MRKVIITDHVTLAHVGKVKRRGLETSTTSDNQALTGFVNVSIEKVDQSIVRSLGDISLDEVDVADG